MSDLDTLTASMLRRDLAHAERQAHRLTRDVCEAMRDLERFLLNSDRDTFDTACNGARHATEAYRLCQKVATLRIVLSVAGGRDE